MSEQISLIKSLLYLSSRRAVLDQPPIACRSFLTEVFSFFAKTLDTAMIRRNTWNRYLLFVCCVLLLAGPFLQRFSLSPKTLDTMIKKKYLIRIFAICVLRIIACGSFHIDVFSLCQNFGYNDKEEILETDICYLLPTYYCIQKVSFSAKTSDTIKK